MNNTIDILFKRLNNPRTIFDERATLTNLIRVAEELKDHPEDMETIVNAFHNYEYFNNMESIRIIPLRYWNEKLRQILRYCI